jgi:hypothetical protein
MPSGQLTLITLVNSEEIAVHYCSLAPMTSSPNEVDSSALDF